MHRNCNNFALFKILSFQGTTSILKKQRDTRQKSSALSCLQSLDMGFGVLSWAGESALGYRWIPNLPLAGLDWVLVKR